MGLNFLALLVFFALSPALLVAQAVNYYDASGRYLGKKQSLGSSEFIYSSNGATELVARLQVAGQKSYYAPSGSYLGSERRLGSSFYLSAPNGRTLATARVVGNSLYYYKPSGEYIGCEKRLGSSVYFYDKSGRTVERATVFGSSASPTPGAGQSTPVPTPVFSPRLFSKQRSAAK